MSRAGKFIPGGSGNKASGDAPAAGRTGPIRAPVAGGPPEATGGKKGTTTPPARGSSLIKPVAKNQRLPIVIMSAVVCCLLVSFAWYEFALVPAQQAAAIERKKAADAQAQIAAMQEEQKKREEAEKAAHSSARATLIVNSKPTGAAITVGDIHKSTPITLSDLIPGKVTVSIHTEGYHDYVKEVVVSAEQPLDLGTIELVPYAASVSFSSPQSDVEYSLTGPNNFSRQGQVPDKLENIPVGDYQLTVWQGDWKLPTITFSLRDQENLKKEIKFPYACGTITSTPSGATVRQGHVVLGRTPLTLPLQRPGDLQLSIDLPPYVVQRFTVHLPEFGNVATPITLTKGKDFIATGGIDMVWVPDGEFWAGKYEVTQSQYEAVVGSNPSTFRRPNRPVDNVTWEAAKAFCDKLTLMERKVGKLPPGYHYALPTESQWSLLSADADIDQAPMSRTNSLSSTQDVGASEPNKYGIYDTLGNVWEWCLDVDDKGFHSLRGGSWLSSPANFPNADTRNIGGPKYSDRFTGFRVVLVQD